MKDKGPDILQLAFAIHIHTAKRITVFSFDKIRESRVYSVYSRGYWGCECTTIFKGMVEKTNLMSFKLDPLT